MLKLTYPKYSYGSQQEPLEDSILLWNHQPLCIKGEMIQDHFFSTLLSWGSCRFTQSDLPLSIQDVKAHSVWISTDIQLPKHLTLHELLSVYGEQQSFLELPFDAYFDLSKRLHVYPKEKQLLFQTMLKLQYPAFLLIITGDWTHYPETVSILKQWMGKRIEQDGYILLHEGARQLFPTAESIDLSQPKPKNTGFFLEEDVTWKHVHMDHPNYFLRLIQFPWLRSFSKLLYGLSATILLVLLILVIQFHSTSIKEYDQTVQKIEQEQSYALSLVPSNANHWKDEFTIPSMLSQEQVGYLSQLFPEAALYALNEGELQMIDQGKAAEILRGEEKVAVDQQYEGSISIAHEILSIPKELASIFFHDETTSARGIYLSEGFAESYGIEAGDILHVPFHLPLRAYPENSGMSQYQVDNHDLLYMPLYETIKTDLTVKQIIKDPYTLAVLRGQNYVEAWIDEELYEQLKVKIEQQGLYVRGEKPKNFSQEAYMYQLSGNDADTTLVPYTSREYLLLATSQTQLNHIKETLDQDSYLYMRTMDPFTSMQEINETMKEEKSTFQSMMQPILFGMAGIGICSCLLYSFALYRFPKPKKKRPYTRLSLSAWFFVLGGGILYLFANKERLQILLNLLLPKQGFAPEYTVSFQRFILFLNAIFEYTMTSTSWVLLIVGSLGLGLLPFCFLFIIQRISKKRNVRHEIC